MSKTKEQKGFTLVELAIVLVIVGLLIGGILKGQELMHNARVTATVSQLKSYEAAVTNFYDMYKEKPGDLSDGHIRIAGCENCRLVNNGATGNGRVGTRNWNIIGRQTFSIETVANATTDGEWPDCSAVDGTDPAAVVDGDSYECAETTLFWYQLLKAGLISGVTGEGVTVQTTAGTITAGEAVPTTPIGGALWVGNASGQGVDPDDLGRIADGANTFPLGVRGTVLLMVATADMDGRDFTDSGLQMMYPKDAANIDRKLDDGLPYSGVVEAYGTSYTDEDPAAEPATSLGGCVVETGTGYAENVNSRDCGLIIRVFK